MGVLNAMGLPPGTGMLLGFVSGFAVGTVLSPVGILALPFIFAGMQKTQAGGKASFAAEYDEPIRIYPLDDDKKTVSAVFSRAPYFAVVKGKKILSIVENPYRNAPGGASWYIVNYLLQFYPQEVVVRTIGRNAEALLYRYGVRVKRIS